MEMVLSNHAKPKKQKIMKWHVAACSIASSFRQIARPCYLPKRLTMELSISQSYGDGSPIITLSD
jgi:hypothetical protein